MSNYHHNQQPGVYDDGGGNQPDYFDDEPNQHNNPYAQSNILNDSSAPFEDHDPYARHAAPPRTGGGAARHNARVGGGGGGRPTGGVPEQAQGGAGGEPPRRRHKYSTADMNETNQWKKWCYILGLFLFFLAFMIGLSILFQHFFFGDTSDNGPTDLTRPDNATFSKDKQEVDSACGRGTFAMDDGALCTEACVPHFFKCCDPFDEFDLYGDSTEGVVVVEDEDDPDNPNNATKIAARPTQQLGDKNTTFLDAYNNFDESTCSFDQDLRGCMAYAKCQALGGQTDPAPANLPDMCSFDRLDKDDETCKELCRPLACCYSQGSDNCLAEKFDLCMDYAPCQNLRYLDKLPVIPTAPRTLDYECFWQQPECHDHCKVAECCNKPGDESCFQFDFMACLTYAPCNDVTEVSIVVPPQFNSLNKPPDEIIYACNAHHEKILEPSAKKCEDYCVEAACCWDQDADKNCFHDDPLSCLAWEAQCQVLLDGPATNVVNNGN